MTPQVAYRVCTPQDLPLIWNSWLKSYRANNEMAKAVGADTYYRQHRVLIGELCNRSAILIACDPEYPDQIYGYAVYEVYNGPVLVMHYVYVKKTYRRFGIATELVHKARLSVHHPEGMPVGATHATYLWLDHLKDRWHMWFNPYLLGLSA